jgi:electron transfer flavoprotein alpha subunit
MDYKGIMVFAEQHEGKIHPVSFELLGKSQELAEKLGTGVAAVLLGQNINPGAQELVQYGANRVYVYDHPSLDRFDLLNYKHNIVRLVNRVKPEIMLFGATHLGRSLGPRVAAALDTGLTADCTGLGIDSSGSLIQIRPAFSGNIFAHIKTQGYPQMATVRYKVMTALQKDPSRRGEIIPEVPEIVPSLIQLTAVDSSGAVNLPDAEVIISGGRGLRKAGDFALLTELADLLGGVVGSSRPLVDAGWIAKEHQVGFSGNTVKPKVYIACGISGSPQHMAGMRNSDLIIAINADPSAPIFRIADYGLVGDLYEILPRFITEVKRRRNEK